MACKLIEFNQAPSDRMKTTQINHFYFDSQRINVIIATCDLSLLLNAPWILFTVLKTVDTEMFEFIADVKIKQSYSADSFRKKADKRMVFNVSIISPRCFSLSTCWCVFWRRRFQKVRLLLFSS